MNRLVPILAFSMIAIGVAGLVVVGYLSQSFHGFSQGYGLPYGMMSPGMMGRYGHVPNVNATPIPSDKPIDREVKIVARNGQFDPTRLTVKKGENIQFMVANQDGVAHNFISQDGKIAYTFLPPNTTQSVIWVAPEQGTYTALCTFHAGMQLKIVVE
jgi:plastocyanin